MGGRKGRGVNKGSVSTSAAGGREGGLPIIRASWPGLIASRSNRYTGDGDSLSAGRRSCVHFILEIYNRGVQLNVPDILQSVSSAFVLK